MEFKKDTDVFTAHDEQVGQIDRVVIDPRTKEITHVVVRKGWLFTEDKVVPIEMIGGATQERVTLSQDVSDLQNLPDFEETHYLPLNEAGVPRTSTTPKHYVPRTYWYPQVVETEQHIPEGTIALKEGAKVITAEGDQVGNIEELVIDSTTGRVTHLVISQGLLFKERKLVPSDWINTVEEDEVHLVVRSGTLNSLHPFANSS
jgi:uncharacterized protein YrrD